MAGKLKVSSETLNAKAAEVDVDLPTLPSAPKAPCELTIAQEATGFLLNNLQQLDAALTRLRHALELNPNLADAHANLGLALWGLGRADEAIAALRRNFEDRWRIRSVPRAENARADALVNEALDGQR